MKDSGVVGTAQWYRGFAEVEARGSSPTYEAIALAVAEDRALIDRIRGLPTEKRQPNLLLAAAKLDGAPLDDPRAWIAHVHDHWESIRGIVMDRWTQTNEAARTGAILPVIGQVRGPPALIEVGTSAGLCLYPDRYRIDYEGIAAVGPQDSSVEVRVACTGPVPVLTDAPEIRSRAGIDRNPLVVTDPEDLRWLEACIWPEHSERAERLHAAAAVVTADPPRLIRGDLLDEIGPCLASVPGDVTPVVFHSAVLGYLQPEARRAFAEVVAAHPRAVWISNEGPGVVESLHTELTPPPGASSAYFVLGVDGRRVEAIGDPHGRWLRWRAE